MYLLGGERSDEDRPQGLVLLPTPLTSDQNMPSSNPARGEHQLRDIDRRLLPTPVTEPETGNGHARNLGAESRLLPTPMATDATGSRANTGGNPTLNGAITGYGEAELRRFGADAVPNPIVPGVPGRLLPTPEAKLSDSGPDYARAGREESGGDDLTTTVFRSLLPTPQAHDAVKGKTADQVAAMRARGYGVANLNEVAENTLLPTPRASDGPDESSHGRTWSKTDRSLHSIIHEGQLLPTPTVWEQRGTPEAQNADRSGLLPIAVQLLPTPTGALGEGGQTSRSGDRKDELLLPGIAEQLLPTPTASLMNQDEDPEQWEERRAAAQERLGNGNGYSTPLGIAVRIVDWGEYGPVIERWERILGRPAPDPTVADGRNGARRLNPRFVEWMMGCPEGWVTDVGLTRNEQLKALGNGVVQQQATLGVAALLARVAERVRIAP